MEPSIYATEAEATATHAKRVKTLRDGYRAGYQDGYRKGLAARAARNDATLTEIENFLRQRDDHPNDE